MFKPVEPGGRQPSNFHIQVYPGSSVEIRLIGTFAHEHPSTPLTWIIASRPVPHIINAFNDILHKSEFIPIDSPQACSDVERFLRDSFGTIRHDFPSTTDQKRPQEIALAKLSAVASGFFIFAETAIRFIRDPSYSDPVLQFRLLLSRIDSSTGVEQYHFQFLDNLYTEILSTIPVTLLSTTQRLLRLALAFRSNYFLEFSDSSKSRTLRGMAVILQLERYRVYAAPSKNFPMFRIPPWERAHKDVLTFIHGSFANYLMDARRSGKFCIDIDGVEDDVLLRYLDLWHKHFGENVSSGANLINEYGYERQRITVEGINKFNKGIFKDAARTLLTQIVERSKPRPGSWQKILHEFDETGLFSKASSKDIKFHYSGSEKYIVVQGGIPSAHDERFKRLTLKSHKFPPDVLSESTESFLKRSPDLPVFICGAVPNGRVALFKGDEGGNKYYIVPYYE